MDYHRQNGVDIRIGRIFNTYGPRMAVEDGRVISNFVVQALRGKPLTVYGDGSQTRSFCYASDMVRGLLALMDSGRLEGPMNLGNPDEFPILEVAETIIRITKSSSRIVHEPLPQDDPVRRCPDITRARTQLGWTPEVGLEEGLKRTVEYFRSKIAAGSNP
jgi:UDP-glucuronate decarboxylase